MHRVNTVGRLALLLAAVSSTAVGLANGADRRAQPVAALDIRPRMAFAGHDVRILVRVPPDPDNRRLRLTIDSGSFSRTSEIDLEGLQAPAAHWFNLPALPSGDYMVEAIVYGSTGPRRRLEGTFSRQ
jgi:hypothetical protein